MTQDIGGSGSKRDNSPPSVEVDQGKLEEETPGDNSHALTVTLESITDRHAKH
jgi:hypothetical protein